MTYDTPVMLGDGRLTPIGEFVEARLAQGARRDNEGWEFAPGGGDVMSFVPETGAVAPRPIEACWRHEAPETLLQVELASGARITVTPEHPFHTLAAGEIVTRRADELAVDEVVAVPTQVELPGVPLDLFAALRDCRDLYVVGRQESVRAAVAALIERGETGDAVALARRLGVVSNTLRSWMSENAIPVAHFFDLMERAGRADEIGSVLNLKGRTAKTAIRVPRFATAKMWRLAGMIMGDGHVRATYVEFHNTNPVLQRQFADLVAREFGLVAQFQPQAKRVDRSRVFSSALATLMQEAFGVPRGEKSRRLRLPGGATALPREHVAELLGGLFDTDASVAGPADKATIEFGTASDGLVSDVGYLLLRLGVRARLGKRNVGGRVVVSGLGPLRRFAESVTLHHPLKRARLEALKNSHADANTNVDRFPGLATELEQLRLGAGATQQGWAERLGVSRRLVGFYESGERAPSRTVLARVAQASAEPSAARLGHLAAMPILWDPIVRITPLVDHGQRYVYDLTVAGSHTFIAGFGGVVAHNTTLLNVLSSFIPSDERIVTIEDAAELQLRQEHVVRLESRPPNIEGHGAITIRDLVRNALRMRPDRIVVGECRGGEALDMLQAMNTGHDGSLTTGHANSPRDMLARLETMVLMAGMDLPVRAIREQIAAAVDLIVQQTRLRDGSRRVTRITEVQGMEGEVITLQDIFVFDQRGTDENGKIIGDLLPTGIRPKFIERIEAEGIEIPLETFMRATAGRVN
ncbi:MAG TPA: ATPase, T2SS/T4P/T4SS family [Limnochordia bacterium]|nr:ATPase, T2SS/T4P/T4SS family [Limnochordia bacterium]